MLVAPAVLFWGWVTLSQGRAPRHPVHPEGTAMSTGKDWAGCGWQAGGDGGKAGGELNGNGDYLGEKGEI